MLLERNILNLAVENGCEGDPGYSLNKFDDTSDVIVPNDFLEGKEKTPLRKLNESLHINIFKRCRLISNMVTRVCCLFAVLSHSAIPCPI